VCKNDSIKQFIPFETLSYREAIRRALQREEQDKVYTRWSDAYPKDHSLAMKLSELGPDNFRWGVALFAPQDPGNIGTILRTIDGAGASGLLLLDDPQEGLSSADAYHPNAVRASMGTLFWYPVVISSFADFAGWARQNGYHVYGTSAHGSTDYREVESYPRPCILLMGSEREGLTPGQVALCQVLIRMPMRGHATSLNLAVATGVMLYAMLEKPLENSR